MDPDVVAEVEGDRLALLAGVGLRDDDAASMSRLCTLCTGSPPLRGRITSDTALCYVDGATRATWPGFSNAIERLPTIDERHLQNSFEGANLTACRNRIRVRRHSQSSVATVRLEGL